MGCNAGAGRRVSGPTPGDEAIPCVLIGDPLGLETVDRVVECGRYAPISGQSYELQFTIVDVRPNTPRFMEVKALAKFGQQVQQATRAGLGRG